VRRAREKAEQCGVKLQTHIVAGHPVRDIVLFSEKLGVDLLGATGHSEIYERLIGSRADRIIQLAPCPVLEVK
jgi:nucleotide-binding universal stress UspA family protein